MSNYPHLEQLIATMARLRGEAGCEWDREQTHESLVRFLIEETYELVDAIESGDREGMKEELGDVLYQLLFHADIAASADQPFTIDDVAQATDEKMRRRHPHVFGDIEVDGIDDIKANWQKIKAEEKQHRESVFDGLPGNLTGLARASALLDKAQKLGVTPDAPTGEAPADEQAFGAWLLAMLYEAKQRGIDSDRALRDAMRLFEQRARETEKDGAD
ncbi:MAG: MazG family protein [Pontimonas sp.]